MYSSFNLSNVLLLKFHLQIIDDQILQLIEEIPRDFIPDNDDKKKVQKEWDVPRIKKKFSEMFEYSGPFTRARRHQQKNHQSGCRWSHRVN